MKPDFTLQTGNPTIPGVTRLGTAINFMIEVQEGDEVSLLLYRRHSHKPEIQIPLGEEYRVGRVYAVMVSGLDPSLYEYNFSVNGVCRPDPYARGIVGREHFGMKPEDLPPHSVRCLFGHDEETGREENILPLPDYRDMILYKLHVRGYTKALSSLGAKRGTFAGLAEMIPYLSGLGINAVELMPAYEFDEFPPSGPRDSMVNIRQGEARINFWGYGSGLYCAPKSAYCFSRDPESEFLDLIKSLHRAGIACIMEFYFPREITNLHALTCLRYWKIHYHVDGFHLVGEGAPVEMALRDAVLSDTLIMATGFDLNSLPRDASHSKRVFAEYNNGFMQDMRRFLKSDEGMVEQVRSRIGRSNDQMAVINYMACQDGFTMMDMVSYNEKHNEDNGEDNRDGCGTNYSWNCGVEGPTRKQTIRNLRQVQLRNAFAMLLLSQEVPMIYAGDEFGNSQKGNNNSYCQDNPVGWVDWKNRKKYTALETYVRNMIAFRKEHTLLHYGTDVEGKYRGRRGFPVMSFHSDRAWFCSNDSNSRLLGVMYAGPGSAESEENQEEYLYVAYNFSWEEKTIALPALNGNMEWRKILDTGDLGTDGLIKDPKEYEKEILLSPRTIVVLIGI